jgi:hypothetical protein
VTYLKIKATTISIHHVNRRYVISAAEITLDSVEQNNSATCFGPTGNNQVFQEREINTQFGMETEISIS